ncbi:MAG: hypothetical protein J0J01_07550 [Reyranella sp.]|uniref:hypothetical protein n=1 Tax=Reyranella sp. TaxID=1929291 RepID=UPI001ACBF950|nr:hypothetical protein [Reyranella sp.]MBN9086746.1 hypothetical protein [Reyranella sp.]
MRQRHALRFLAEHADLIFAEGMAWLLTSAPPELVDMLACLDADKADLEPDVDAEPDHEGGDNFGPEGGWRHAAELRPSRIVHTSATDWRRIR